MSSNGDCFIVLPDCAEGKVIFGRNAEDSSAVGVAQEVHYHDASESAEGKNEDGADTFRIVLQKPKAGVWGGDCGANERNVAVGVSWESADNNDVGEYGATDLVRLVLATATTAEHSVERIGSLVEAHASDNLKCSLVVCDGRVAWLVSCGGRLWAAQSLAEGCRRVPADGMAVSTVIDKSSADLGDALKTLGLWNGEGDLDFAKCFNATPTGETSWCGDKTPTPAAEYSVIDMFETLRSAAHIERSRSSAVFALNATGIGCHWFTATPCASESVFKPFVFAPHPRISPLTKVADECDETGGTLLHKLHGQRKAAAVDDLRALEAACVAEVSAYIGDHPSADEELDDLMKDCVEAEVKFYR